MPGPAFTQGFQLRESFCGHGIDRLVMSRQQVARRHVPVPAIDQIVVSRDEPLAVPLVGCRNLVPRQAGLFVVDYVEVVVKEQQAQHGSVLDDSRPVPDFRFRPVFREGANQRQS